MKKSLASENMGNTGCWENDAGCQLLTELLLLFFLLCFACADSPCYVKDVEINLFPTGFVVQHRHRNEQPTTLQKLLQILVFPLAKLRREPRSMTQTIACGLL